MFSSSSTLCVLVLLWVLVYIVYINHISQFTSIRISPFNDSVGRPLQLVHDARGSLNHLRDDRGFQRVLREPT